MNQLANTILILIILCSGAIGSPARRCPTNGTLVSHAQCIADRKRLPIEITAVDACDDRGRCRLTYDTDTCNERRRQRVVDVLFGVVLRAADKARRVSLIRCQEREG